MAKSNKKLRPWKQYIALLSLPIALFFIAVGLINQLDRPTNLETVQNIHIQGGMNARTIGELLADRGLIRNAHLFEWLVRWKGLERNLEAGDYQLDGSHSTTDIIRLLLQAPIQVHPTTIPEGLTRQQVAGLLQKQSALDSAKFIELTADPELIHHLGIKAPTLEGYLFPNTYFLASKTSEREVIELMVGEFHKVFADSLYPHLKKIGLTLHQAVTLASIVEGEAIISEERPIIAAVFLKRLRLNRMLESCATVEYALGVHKKRLTNADLKVQSPYNTYLHRGLPPAPICNPGKASLLATLFPAATDYLYFVARGDGSHIFNHTHAGHNRSKRAIKLAMRRNRVLPN
ncbi:MAG: aminodeoxychorismate lyase [Magnetovibrio sp.]|nr:aminodeoxychorismate lyase [Magnetovibrio sp.]